MAMKILFLQCLFLYALLWRTRAQVEDAICPNLGGYVFIPHSDTCFFYTCYRGALLSPTPYECPSDSKYYALLEESGLRNPCSTCPYSPTPTDILTSPTPDVKTSPTDVKTSPPLVITTTSPPEEPSTSETSSSSAPPDATTTSAATTSSAVPTEAPSGGGDGDGDDGEMPDTPAIREIFLIVPNAHVHGAKYTGDNTTLRQCLHLCERTQSCLGFNFDLTHNSCWIHTDLSVCGQPQDKPNCTHFSLYDKCPKTTASPPDAGPSTTKTVDGSVTGTPDGQPPSETPYTAAFSGRHLQGGEIIPLATGAATAEMCVAICRMDQDCAGVDFDSVGKACWVHDAETECGGLMEKEGCTHFRLRDICEPLTPSAGPLTTTTPRPAITTTTTTATPSDGGGDLIIDVTPSGFFEFLEGYHVTGGLRVYDAVTLRQCLDACLTSSYCLALDYDVINQACYFHYQSTYCGAARELPGNYHLKRLPCIEGSSNDAVATWFRFHAESGQEFCTGCTLGYCLEACYANPQCAGIDFDVRNLGCYVFTAGDVCGPLIPKDYCVHMSRDTCVPDELTGIGIESLALLVFPPPIALPSGWHAYPGVRVRHGFQIMTHGASPDTCVAICEAEPRCASGDFDLSDGSCWLHVGDGRQCGQVEPSSTVFHFKKDPCDVVYGTLQLYVSPVWTA